MEMSKLTSKPVLSFMTVLSFIALLIDVILNSLSALPGTSIYLNDIGNLSDKYATNINPASYAFSIWSVIFIWQICWTGYAVTTICRRNSEGPVLITPVVLPFDVHIFWIICNCFTVSWLFVWDRELVSWSAVVLVTATFFGYLTLFRHSFVTASREDEIPKAELIAIRVLIQNGMGIFFSWITIASSLNISFALTFGPSDLPKETASIISVCILGVIVVTWSILENTVFFKAFRFFYIWYAVLIWASSAVLVKNYNPSNPSTILVIMLLCTSVVALLVKIGVHVKRSNKGRLA